MNVDNQTLVHIKAGNLAPEELLERIIATKPTAFGFAVQEPDGAEMVVVREDGTNLDIANLRSFMEESKASPKTLYFGTLKQPYDAEDIQPYTVTDPDDKTFLTIFTEGTLNGHDDPAAHIEHYNYVNGLLIPKIVEWCEDFDGDIEKIMAKLGGPMFKKEFLMHVGHRAVLNIIPFTGDAVTISKNELGGEFEWGWTSQLHGFGQKKAEEPVSSAKTTKGWGSKRVNAPGVHNVADLPKDTATKGADGPRTSVPEVAGPSNKDGKSIPVMVRPPSWLHKNDDIRAFYQLLGGGVPSAWKKKIPIEVKQNHALLQAKNIDEFNKWRLENMMSTTSAGSTQTKAERINASMEPADNPLENTDPKVLPILEPKDLEKVLDFVAKHLDGGSREIIPPHEMQKLEKELPSFCSATATTLEDQLNWPVAGLFGLASVDPRAVVLFALGWRAYARPFLQAELQAKAKNGEKVINTVTDLGNGSKKTESIVVKTSEAAPAKKGWGYGKNKAA